MINIAVILQGMTILLLLAVVIRQIKDVKKLKEDMWEVLNNRNHISRMEQNSIEETGRDNWKLIQLMALALDKKIEPILYGGLSVDYELVDLTEKEKRANELRREIEKLEESDD